MAMLCLQDPEGSTKMKQDSLITFYIIPFHCNYITVLELLLQSSTDLQVTKSQNNY